MSLDLLEAVERVSGATELKDALAGTYFCSAITFLQPGKPVDYWDLNYYNPARCDISHIRVSEDSLEIKSVDKPLKKEEPKKIDVDTIRLGIDKSLEIATEVQARQQKSSIQKVFVALYSEEAAVWAISFILGGMKIFQVRLDARDGKVIDSKLLDFMQKSTYAS